MALNDNALVTWDQLKRALGISKDDDESRYEWLINGASSRIEQMVGRKLFSAERTEYQAGHGGEIILLDCWPVSEIDSLYVDANREFGSDTEIDSEDYDLDSGSGVVYLLGKKAPRGRKIIKVTYTGGYESIPEDLQAATVEIVVANFRRMAKNQGGIKSISAPDSVGTTYELSIPVNARQVIELYKGGRV